MLLALLLPLVAGTAGAQDWPYRIRPGDTLWDLAGRYLRQDIPWQKLQAHNNFADPYRLTPGSRMGFPVAWLKQQPAKAKVIAVHGKATARGAHDGEETDIAAGTQFGIDTMLRTAPDAGLTLQFADGSRLLLQGGSELVLDKLSSYGATGMADTRLRLPRGRVTNSVTHLRGPASRFIIETPHTMSSVRGTQFRIGSDGAHAQAEVLQGSVAVSGGGRHVLLQPGQGTASDEDGQPGAATALLPAPDIASITLDATQSPPRLHWAAVPGATAYRVQADINADFFSVVHDEVVTTNATTFADLDSRDYNVRVRAIDANGIEGRDAVTHMRVASQPPFMLSPVDGARVATDRPRMRWAAMGDGVRYRLQLADAAGFDQPLVDESDLAATDTRSPHALPPGDYAWRVAAIDASGRTTGFGDAARFTLLASQPGPGVERAATSDDPRTLHVRWAAGESGQHYRVQVSRKADFAHPEVDREVDDNEIALPGLKSGTWYVRTRAVDSDGHAGEFGPAQQIRLGCTACRWVAVGGGVLLLLAL